MTSNGKMTENRAIVFDKEVLCFFYVKGTDDNACKKTLKNATTKRR